MKSIWIYVLLGLTIILACGGGQAARTPLESRPIPQLRGDQEIRDLKRDIEQLDSALAAETAKVNNLIAAVTHINNRMEEIDMRLLKVESMMISYNSNGYLNPNIPLNPEIYETEYRKALQAFDSSRYDDALSVFQKLVNSNPNSELADNSQYWIGECFYGLKNYERALLEFEKVFTYPNNNKMDAAQIKIGICYLKLRNPKKANDEFNRLIQLYPDSEYISLSNKLIRNL